MSKVAVVYWSGTGNTEKMAEEIAEAARGEGLEVDVFFSDDFNKDMVENYSAIAFGCSAMGDEELEESSFAPMFDDCEPLLKGKDIAIFGSYEWNNGEWMEDWEKRVNENGSNLLYEPLPVYDYPDSEALEKCRELGKSLKK